jgi:Circularly permutated YpsA SLOG family
MDTGPLERIISGGQTGADRAALDTAIEYGYEVGGWVPRDRAAEDGPIPDEYPGLVETEASDPAERTKRNVRDADATLLVSHGPLLGGSRLTAEEARRLGRPVLHVDLHALSADAATLHVRAWLLATNPRTLNVAGPRASEDPDIYDDIATLLRSVLARREHFL